MTKIKSVNKKKFCGKALRNFKPRGNAQTKGWIMAKKLQQKSFFFIYKSFQHIIKFFLLIDNWGGEEPKNIIVFL